MSKCTTRELFGDSRGAAIVLIAITMVALLSAAALAIDIGMLLNARGEAQRAADAAALAGAGALINPGPDPEADARQFATDWAAQNFVTDMPVTLLPEDIDVDLGRQRVTVTVRRFADRGQAVGTWFANVFGVGQVDVAARAAAEVQPSGRARCVKPFTLPDYWDDMNADSIYQIGEPYDPPMHGYGSSWRNPGRPGDDGQGYINDRGRSMIVKQGGPPAQPGWFQPWEMPQQEGADPGANNYRENIAVCNTNTIEIGEEYPIQTGAMDGPTVQGAEDLIAMDPNAVWNPTTKQLDNSRFAPNWMASPRIGIVPLYDPARSFIPGKNTVVFSNFIAVFFESVTGKGINQEINVRVLNSSGVSGGDSQGSNHKAIRLVE